MGFPASSAGGLTKIYDSGTLGASQATIDTGANGIPGGHADLYVSIYVRTDRAAQQDNLNILVNNDSAAHYDMQRLQGLNVTASSVTNNAVSALTGTAATVPSASDTAGQFACLELFIPNYDNTTGFKVASVLNSYADETASQNGMAVFSASWRSTVAINRLSIAPVAGTNLVAGSRMVVYGCQ